MGCDIHLHTEVKINGKWEHYSVPDVPRNYKLFEKMAGVRGDIREAIAEPRGMPNDATVVTRFDCKHEEPDGHSHSWLNADEIGSLARWIREQKFGENVTDADFFGWIFGMSWYGWLEFKEDRPPGIEDIRFVFWFDN